MSAVAANPVKTIQKYVVLTAAVLGTIYVARRVPVVKDLVAKALAG
ncbi:MAG: hypothetical protein J0H69_00610 [Burkholderiales bacterium]|nr:hypothetical protein [Burkholderiales bacterium]